MTSPSLPHPYFQIFKNSAGLWAAMRAMVKTIEFTYSWSSYAEKQEFAQEGHSIIPKEENSTRFDDIYNIATSLNTIRALSLVKNIGDFYYHSNDLVSIGTNVGLHAVGITFDYLKPEEYFGYKTGTAIHYLPEFVGIPLTAALIQSHSLITAGKLDLEHFTTILKNLVPSAGITTAFLGNKYAQQDYKDFLQEGINNSTLTGNDTAAHDEL